MKKQLFEIIKLPVKIFKHKYVIAGTPVIITNSEGKILLGKRTKKAMLYPNTWGLPGGLIEYGEKVEDAAKREVKEELGVEIKIIKKIFAYETLPTKKYPLHSMSIPFYAKIIKGVPKPMDETSEVRWFYPKQIRNIDLAYNHKEILKKEGFI